MTPNVDLLRATMDEILAHPDLHAQDYWAVATDCGTAYCFAGWACVLSGVRVESITSIGADTMFTEAGEFIWDEAQILLGLDTYSAAKLFDGTNSPADLKHYVDEIAEHGHVIPNDPWARDLEVPF